jgi:hypothetical protein
MEESVLIDRFLDTVVTRMKHAERMAYLTEPRPLLNSEVLIVLPREQERKDGSLCLPNLLRNY